MITAFWISLIKLLSFIARLSAWVFAIAFHLSGWVLLGAMARLMHKGEDVGKTQITYTIAACVGFWLVSIILVRVIL